MVQWFRVRSRTLAAFVLLALAALSLSTALPHGDDCHGESCAAGIVGPHSAESHRVGAPSSHEPHQHCAVCHWVRAFRHSVSHTPAVVGITAHDVRIHTAVLAAPLVFPAAQPPLRSPPSAPSLV
jgi:hypothetical protein